MPDCLPVGLLAPDKVAQESSTISVDLSASIWILGGRIDCWSSSVDAADAKKAEGAIIIIIIIIILLLLLLLLLLVVVVVVVFSLRYKILKF